MRIAVFYNLQSGGAKRALYGQVKYLHSVGHELEIYVPSTNDETYLSLRELASGFHEFRLRLTPLGLVLSTLKYGLPPMLTIVDQEKTHRRIAAEINADPCDLVFSEHDQFTGAPFLFRYLQKPVVYYCPEPLRFQEKFDAATLRGVPGLPKIPAYKRLWKSNWQRRLPEIDVANAQYVKHVLTNSYFSKEAIMRAFGLNAMVSYLGIDTQEFRPLDIPREDFVLSVGVCASSKGFDFVIRALSLVPKSLRPRFVIVANRGSDSWGTYLMQLASELNVELEIKKAVPDEELVTLYNQARLFVYGAVLEPFGLAPLEAMACATAVVAVKEGGVRESVVHGETGILSDRDEEAFAQAVSELLHNNDLRTRLGDNALESVRSFWSWEEAGKRLVGHLDRVAGSQRSGPTL